jgi:hypothetical protein
VTGCDNEENPCVEELEAQTRLLLENLETARALCTAGVGNTAIEPGCSFADTMECLLDEAQCNRNSEDGQVDTNELFAYALQRQLECLEQR